MTNDEVIAITLNTMAEELQEAAYLISIGEYRKADNLLVMVTPRLQSVSADVWRKHHPSGVVK